MSQHNREVKLLSAGGVVYRGSGDHLEVAICGRLSPPLWGLPKGTPEPDETREQTAIREVTEETGLEVEIEGFIDSIEYWFLDQVDGVRYNKTVLFYLMSATGGDISLHDHEFDTVVWTPCEDALNTLTYVNEVKIVESGLSMVSKKNRPG